MEDTRHVFNVIFKMPRRSPTDPGEMSNVTSFDVKPVYWTAIIIPAKGAIEGRIDLYCLGRDILSASNLFITSASLYAVPRMYYSASPVFSGCTIFSASTVVFDTTT